MPSTPPPAPSSTPSTPSTSSTSSGTPAKAPPPVSDRQFLRRLLIVIGVGTLTLALYRLQSVILLVFASLLLAVIYDAMAGLLERYLHFRRTPALMLAFLVTIGSLVALIAVFGRRTMQQLRALAELLPQALEQVATRFGIPPETLAIDWTLVRASLENGVLPQALGYSATVLSVVANVLLVLAGGLFLALQPRIYLDGAAMLLPPQRQALFRQAVGETGRAMRYWISGQMILMLAVGLSSWLVYAWIGLPSAAALALIAGLTNFIPFIGPFLGAVPAVLVAAGVDMQTAGITVLAVVLIQQLESYALAPFVHRKTVQLPPFVGLFAIVIFGTLFGTLGVLLAVPAAVMLLVLVQRLWVRNTLGYDIDVLGAEQTDAADADAARGQERK